MTTRDGKPGPESLAKVQSTVRHSMTPLTCFIASGKCVLDAESSLEHQPIFFFSKHLLLVICLFCLPLVTMIHLLLPLSHSNTVIAFSFAQRYLLPHSTFGFLSLDTKLTLGISHVSKTIILPSAMVLKQPSLSHGLAPSLSIFPN